MPAWPTPKAIRLAVARPRPVWFSMDIYNTEYTQSEGAKNGTLEDNLRKDREIAQTQRDNFRAAHRAGVRMVFAQRCRGHAARPGRRASSDHGRPTA